MVTSAFLQNTIGNNNANENTHMFGSERQPGKTYTMGCSAKEKVSRGNGREKHKFYFDKRQMVKTNGKSTKQYARRKIPQEAMRLKPQRSKPRGWEMGITGNTKSGERARRVHGLKNVVPNGTLWGGPKTAGGTQQTGSRRSCWLKRFGGPSGLTRRR